MSEGNLITKMDGLLGGSFSRDWKSWSFLMRDKNMRKYNNIKHEFLPSCKVSGKEVELIERYHSRPKLNVSYLLWSASRDIVLYHVEKLIKPRHPKTLEEALLNVDFSKATGILLRETYPDLEKTNKGSFFETNMDEVESLLQKIDEGLMPLSIFSGWLKDELLPRLKVLDEKKCRLFMAASAEHVLISHTLFLDQNKDLYKRCWPLSWSGIGMNKFQGFWPRLRQRMLDLLVINPNLVVASYDGKRHDASCHEEEFEDVAYWRHSRLINGHKYMHRTKYVYRNIIYTVIITEEGKLYLVNGGNKSGQGNTTVDNGLIQFRRYVLILLSMGRMDVIDSFDQEFPPLIILGDDVLCFSPLLTAEDHLTIVRLMKEQIGAVWTVKISDINNWEFCSHSPTEHSNYELAAISESKMVCSLYRTHTFKTNIDRVKGELIESYPTPLFDDLYSFAVDYFQHHNVVLHSKDYYRDHWYGEQTVRVSELNQKSPEKEYTRSHFASSIETLNFMSQTNKLQKRLKERGNVINKQNQEISRLKKNHSQPQQNSKTVVSENEVCNCASKFVMSLIDPEHSEGLKWPDKYSERTSTYRALNNFFLPIATSTDIVDYEAGSYYWEVHPELINTIRYLEEFDGSAPHHVVSGQINTGAPGNNFGFYDSDGRRVTGSLGTGVYDIAIDFRDAGGTLQTPSFVSPVEAEVFESGFYYLPCLANSDHSIRFDMINLGASSDVTIEQIGNDGTILQAQGPETIAHGGVYNRRMDLSSSAKARFSFKLRLTITSAGIANFDGSLTGNYLLDFLRFQNEPLTATVQLQSDLEKYRVVAQSCLATYVGSKLTTAGDCTALLYRGGLPASFNEVIGYSTIAEHPDSYEGYMEDGTYTYWEGQDDSDYIFRNLFADESFRRPYMMGAGVYTGDPTTGVITGANIIRMRVITVIEFTSKSQVYSSAPSPVNPELIVLAMRTLSGVPNAMENGKHMNKLKTIARGAFKFLKSSSKFLFDNRASIVKGAEMLAPLILV